MSEDWFVDTSSLNCWDEWTFTQYLGANASNVLNEHWSTWIVESDIETMHQAGLNLIRVPTGFWMWIPTTGDEPYVTSGQLQYLNQLCQWAYKRNMYLIIDLHGLPGSQNGEQQSGHNTTSPTFYRKSQVSLSASLPDLTCRLPQSPSTKLAPMPRSKPSSITSLHLLTTPSFLP